MKKSVKLIALLCSLAILVCLALPAFGTGSISITNPYADINWQSVNTYKTSLHSHTNASDGDQTLLQSLERHAQTGFDIVAITNHGITDYGWTNDSSGIIHSGLKLIGRTEGALDALSSDGTLGGEAYTYEKSDNGDDYLKLASGKTVLRLPFGIENNAISINAHVNSWFADFRYNGVATYKDAVRGVEKKGGLSVINHPGEYTKARYAVSAEEAYNESNIGYKYYINKFASLIEKYPSCIGIDINSKGDARTRFDRVLWDRLLTRFSKCGKNVFAIASSDAHQLDKIDTGYSLLLMDELDSKSAKEALQNGEFFAASHCIGSPKELSEIASSLNELYGESELSNEISRTASALNQEAAGIKNSIFKQEGLSTQYSVLDENGFSKASSEPRVESINVDGSTISIEATDALIVRMISGGKLIDTKKADGTAFDLSAYGESLGKYVRFEIFGEGGILYTQAFLLNADEKTADSAVDKHFFDLGIFDFIIAYLFK